MVDECKMSKRHWWKMLTRNNWSSHKKTYPAGILSTITPTLMAWGRNWALAVTGWSLSPIWHNLMMTI